MSDTEATANPADGEIAPDPEAEVTDAPEVELDDDDNPVEPEPEAPAEETEEVERDGKRYVIPKALKAELMMNADYTRKTQALADERKTWDAERTQQVQLQQQHLGVLAKAHALNDQVTAYQNVDWQAWRQQDPDAAQDGFFAYQQAREARDATFADLNQRQQAQALEQQRTRVTQAQQAQSALEHLPGYTAELPDKLDAYAKGLGMTSEQIAQVLIAVPAAAKILHQAFLADQSQKKTATVQKVVASQAAAPTPQIGAKATAAKSQEQMTTAEWMAFENARVAKKNGRR